MTGWANAGAGPNPMRIAANTPHRQGELNIGNLGRGRADGKRHGNTKGNSRVIVVKTPGPRESPAFSSPSDYDEHRPRPRRRNRHDDHRPPPGPPRVPEPAVRLRLFDGRLP